MSKVKKFTAGEYDVVVVGAGHAGTEAALASARMGKKTLMMTMSLDSISMMPCNPSIGGTGKGHLVREIDALGGQMGLVIDKAMIQCRMLNTSKGPAVHSLRAQADKRIYHVSMKQEIENQENLDLVQNEAVEIDVEKEVVKGVLTQTGSYYEAKSVIVCTGTYLKGRIYIGKVNYEGGPGGLFPSNELSDSLKKLDIKLQRLKTGTPGRVHSDTMDYSKMVIQEGDKEIVPFSFMTENIDIDQEPCYLTYTNNTTHDVILENLSLSPMYAGEMDGIGPRYCPSIEDKVNRFSDKSKHQIFVEPEGLDTKEMYIQGMSTTLPEEIQISMYRTIKGMEECKIMRPAYAIEYDCIDPTQLKRSLEYKNIENLFFAGQINGSSGYEEAAGQGLIAGMNAVLKLNKKEPFILDRSEAYIGVLIDDLVTKGTKEPYRMMTSRAEYRLVLRQDNADVRLTQKGYDFGLVKKERYEKYIDKKNKVDREIIRLKETIITPKEKNNIFLKKIGSVPVKSPTSIYDLLKRPEVKYDDLLELDESRPDIKELIKTQVEIEIKYEGYIKKQLKQIKQFKKLENKKLDEEIEYSNIEGLRLEARQKLNKLKPESIGQASRISGVSPADINVLLIYLEQQRRLKN
ncbi:MAG: tRNA uridine-5-carboxymethylaminomethyl(34) synthesis enzyme MnmG [Eubacteriales bacterium]